jgi:hypothetical protein
MSDLKTSLLVNRQVPEFVRDENPKFILFLEAYYEFLDQSGYGKAKELRNISDVDVSLQEFEQQFFNTFLPFIPRNTAVSKEVLIKNILPLYLSKGSERSYKFLFRLLFDQEIQIENPGSQILRASDGRWTQENVLSVDTNIYSEYVFDESTNIYYLPYLVDKSGINVFVNDVEFTDYELRFETRKIIFDDVLNDGDVIRIQYKNFNASVLSNLKILGSVSGASSIIERASRSNTGGVNFYQLILDNKTILGSFVRSDIIEVVFVDDEQNVIPIFLRPYSGVLRIDVTNGGSSYNIGDTVIIRGPSETPAQAYVDDVISGLVQELVVLDGASGFKIGNEIVVEGFSNTVFNAEVSILDSSGNNTSNTLTFNSDVILDYINVSIDSTDYGFPSGGIENVNTVISQALSSNTITGLGTIREVTINQSQIAYRPSFNFITNSSFITDNLRISDLGSIARISIIDGGQNYEVGDSLVFTNNESFSGQGASAEVGSVDGNGKILTVTITNPGLSYQLEYPPIITVDSISGNGANLAVTSIFGTGARYLPILDEEGTPGQIKSIKILSQGSGYEVLPGIDLSFSGDGNATANVTLAESFTQLSGRWTTSDGILSDDQIRLQGRDYYIPYSYVITSRVEFDRYKSLLKNLLHPAGLINYSRYRIDTTFDINIQQDVVGSLTKTIAGTVNVSNNSTTILGTNTDFVIAESSNIISQNTVIVVNDEVRTIVSIDDANTITVNTEFTSNANNKIVKILS